MALKMKGGSAKFAIGIVAAFLSIFTIVIFTLANTLKKDDPSRNFFNNGTGIFFAFFSVLMIGFTVYADDISG